MSTFKNRENGDIITVFGALHDHYAARADFELVGKADRNGARETGPQPEVLDDEPTDSEGSEPAGSQDPTPAEPSDKPRSTK